MNPSLENLQLYPFQKLAKLFEDLAPNDASLTAIGLHIGEPKHDIPEFIQQELVNNLGGLAHYPTVRGTSQLRTSIAHWLMRRYHLVAVNPDTEVIPVNGSREALFAFAQVVIDNKSIQPIVVCQNPFYQIYEGAALLAGAKPYFLNQLPENDFSVDTSQLPDSVWERTQLVYICSPNNPTGKVLTLDEWQHLFTLSDRYGFVIAADECYSEIYFDENQPPLGALEAAEKLGRSGFPRLVVFSSLSKRSNVPGMRSGFVAGDAAIIKKFLLYRTYHGCAMNPAVQMASVAAWEDEQHVVKSRNLYREKFAGAIRILEGTLPVSMPDAGFYLWLKTPVYGTEFARRLYLEGKVTVLPGGYLAREAHGVNPGEYFVRIALVAPVVECMEAMERIKVISEKF
jgi:N-succinyldiaminopimelate aminotransferase